VTPEEAAKQWALFEALKSKLLVDDDYQTIAGKRFIKRSGFRKIAVYFGISDRVLKEERVDREDGSFSWRIMVEAVAPNGRSCIGVGACDSKERSFAHLEHDVYATAHTRAKSRAISDMVAGGIVSAEEVEVPEEPRTRYPTHRMLQDVPTEESKVPVTKDPLSQPGLKQFSLVQGIVAVGMINVLEDEASIVPEKPIRADDPALVGFLFPKVLDTMVEKHPDIQYRVLEADGALKAILIRGKLDETQVKDLANASRWAFQKAMERVGGPSGGLL
jgi:hypothetical protein